ncbi:XAC2610-related protein [Sulfuricurvum sp.]|uniref:XAC2610-related protein n=1 Tax=Sulfuricurvum sp. TaxID=2025608 RepID=UPI002E321B40|nr:hypothetical protein [Sulfuricurvum sp.]HEX5329554.1 hypothetical protein [Sulfuricurvum sp.]
MKKAKAKGSLAFLGNKMKSISRNALFFAIVLLFGVTLSAQDEDNQSTPASHWVKQQAMTPDYRFEIAVTNGNESEGYGSLTEWDGIKVINRHTDKATFIAGKAGGNLYVANDALLSLIDANFDGFPDLQIRAFDGGAGPNSVDYFYLYDPKTKTFKFDEQLSNFSQIGINVRTKSITSAYRDGCCHHVEETYRYFSGVLTLVENWDERLVFDSNMIETTVCKLKKRKMRCKTKTREYSE